jgi:hypothetical protein
MFRVWNDVVFRLWLCTDDFVLFILLAKIHTPMRQDLKDRFQRESRSIASLWDEFWGEIVRWVYSTDELWTYWDLREKGREDTILPGPEGAFFAYGLNGAGHRVMVREFQWDSVWVPQNGKEPELRRIPTTNALREYLIRYDSDCLHVSVLERGALKSVESLQFENRLLMDLETFEGGSYGRQHFFYEGRRKKRVQYFADQEQLSMETHYGSHGEQTFFRVRRDGTLIELGQPLPKGITAKKLKATILDRMRLLIPEVVEKARVAEPIYCVSLGYDGEGNDVLPPLIGIGVESERSRWLQEHGTEAREWIWNPAEFYHFEKPHTQMEDDALEEACDLLNNHLTERGSLAPAVRLLLEVATKLNRATWPASIRKTADFVVYAVDFELGSLRRNMRASLSPEQFADLKARRLV